MSERSSATLRAGLPVAAAVVLTGFYLSSLGKPSLINDEAALANSLIGLNQRSWQERPLLFTAVERGVVAVLGSGEIALRLFPCLAGIATVILVYVIARREIGTWAGAAAAVLLSLSPAFLFHSHVAKHYTIEALFTAVLLLTYLWHRRTPDSARWYGYLGVAFLSLGLSFTSGAVIAAIFLVECLRVRSDVRRLVLLIGTHVALAGTFAVLHVPVQGEANVSWFQDYWVDFFPPSYHPVSLAAWSVRMTVFLVQPLSGFSSAVAGLLCAAAGAAVYLRRERPIVPTVAGLTAGIHLIAAYTGLYPFGEPRLILDLAPLVCLLIGAGLALLVPGPGAPRAAYLALAGVLFVALHPSLERIREYRRGTFGDEDIRDLVREIARSRKPGECIWVSGGAGPAFRYYWYRYTGESQAAQVVRGGNRRGDPSGHLPRIRETAKTCDRVHLLFSHDPIGELDWLTGLFSTHYTMEASRRGKGVALDVYRRRPEPLSEAAIAATIADLRRSARTLERAP